MNNNKAKTVAYHVAKSNGLADNGRYKEALAEIEVAIALDETNFESKANKALLLSEMASELGKSGQGIISMTAVGAAFKTALELNNSWGDGWFNLGNILSDQGAEHEAESISSYRHALVVDPDSAETHNNLGICYQSAGKLADAIHHCAKAVELSPANAEFTHNLASCYHQCGQFEKALKVTNPSYD
jgi:tetratricopeptide (TPR) repeat protein